jgi:hypothetical protein
LVERGHCRTVGLLYFPVVLASGVAVSSFRLTEATVLQTSTARPGGSVLTWADVAGPAWSPGSSHAYPRRPLDLQLDVIRAPRGWSCYDGTREGYNPWRCTCTKSLIPPESVAAQIKEPHDRIEAVKPALAAMGVKIVVGGYPLGEYDVVIITEAADDATAASAALAVTAGARSRRPSSLGC